MLRRAGLTDRFKGGFLVERDEYDSHLPIIASQPFCGGADVCFAAGGGRLLITACHEFDLHVETTESELARRLQSLAFERGLQVRGLDLAA